MITELEPGGEGEEPEGPEESGAGVEVMSGEPEGPGRWPWKWVLGTVVATAALGAVTLQAAGYGQAAPPDLHGYRVSDVSPCGGDNLTPLSSAFGPGRSTTSAMERRTSAALDQARCVFSAKVPIAGTHWQAWYTVTVTVELHKKTDPGPEFEARNRPDGPDLDTSCRTVKPVNVTGRSARFRRARTVGSVVLPPGASAAQCGLRRPSRQ